MFEEAFKLPKSKVNKKVEISPVFGNMVYNSLPDLLKEGTDRFNEKREKDLFILGSICLISGTLSNYTSVYQGSNIFSNLNLFVIAPPASGKGNLKFARELIMPLHEQMKQMAQNESGGKNVEKFGTRLVIPGNTSHAALIEQLERNDGGGIVYETESDTITNTMKQEWGGYSDIIRKSFHHEPISSLRKGNIAHEIDFPRLSFLLSGTPNQVPQLINDVGDGLFSRFMYYTFSPKMKWKSISEGSTGNGNVNHFRELGIKIVNATKDFRNSSITYSMTEDQIHRLDTLFENLITRCGKTFPKEFSGSITRFGHIVYRISMVLSALRQHEKVATNRNIVCDEKDFEVASRILIPLMYHAILVYKSLPEIKMDMVRTKPWDLLLNTLPANKEISRSDLNTIGKDVGIAKRTVNDHIKKLRSEKKLIQIRHGTYKKVT